MGFRRMMGIAVAVVAGAACLGSGVAGARATGTAEAAPPTLTLLGAGGRHTCGLASDGRILCWGARALPDGSTAHDLRPTEVSVAGTVLAGKTITQIAVGTRHACALTSEGSAACWGANTAGQLGDGTTQNSTAPVAVTKAGTALAGKTITELAAGEHQTCAVTSDGGAACWGGGSSGELGNGSTDDSPLPVAVTKTGTPLAGKAITHIATGYELVVGPATCAVTSDGTAACWGNNFVGQLGDGTTDDSAVAVAVEKTGTALAGKAVVQISTGVNRACALTSDGSVACWGLNTYGQVGDGSTGLGVHTATAVATTGTALQGKTVTALAGGSNHECALASDGGVACWGLGAEGELGDGAGATSPTAVAVTKAGTPLAGKAIARIAAGTAHTCATTTDGITACWGTGISGELGDGSDWADTGGSDVAVAIGTAAEVTVPGAPTIGTVTAGNAQATVSWTAPSSDGGSPVTGYVVTPYAGATAKPAVTFSSTATTQVVTGLANGTTYTFKVAARNTKGTGAQSAASVAVTPQAPYRPFASWDAFVARQLSDFAGSAGTTASRAPSVAQLSGGSVTPAAFIAARLNGSWYAPHVAPVARLYWAYFGRIPDQAGVTYWAGKHRSGTSLNTVSQSFASSGEFKAKYGSLTNSAFVKLVYTNVLGRQPDAGGLSYWVGRLNAGTSTRGQVMTGFSESAEYKSKMAAKINVGMVYGGMLHRSPTAPELAAGTSSSLTALIDAIRLGAAYATLVG